MRKMYHLFYVIVVKQSTPPVEEEVVQVEAEVEEVEGEHNSFIHC